MSAGLHSFAINTNIKCKTFMGYCFYWGPTIRFDFLVPHTVSTYYYARKTIYCFFTNIAVM